jgi:magnesium chelatase subunit D
MGVTLATGQRIATVLRCMAVDHRIGGLLLFTNDPDLPRAAARWLARAMSTGGEDPPVFVAGSWSGEYDLWVQARLVAGSFRVVPGPLVESGRPPVVLVPELARAGLGVARAAVTLIGADIATAECHGYRAAWRPRARWLAATDRHTAAGLSPHLLDRFPVRVHADSGQTSRAGGDPGDWAGLPEPEPQRAAPGTPLPDVTVEALDEVTGIAGPGLRRNLALARMARAIALLDGAAQTTAGHVRRAAGLLGMRNLDAPAAPVPPAGDAPLPAMATPEPDGAGPAAAGPVPVTGADPPTAVEPATATGELYPEEAPDALPEAMSLRSPWAGVSRSRQRLGQKTGVERTRSPVDLALVPTLFEAAKSRHLRPTGGGLIIRPEDWRRYRRGWVPHRVLVMVLDHTCRRGWDWTRAVAPYLQWAYVERTPVCVVDLGHDGAVSELRAERYRAASVRDPRVLRSLHRQPGRATPLASGIELAAEELLSLVRRGRATVGRAWLVVVTDGRGNIPLEASARDRVDGAVGRQGVEDALMAARAVRPIIGVRVVVAAPPDVAPYASLPFDLADALGGVVTSAGSPDSGTQLSRLR